MDIQRIMLMTDNCQIYGQNTCTNVYTSPTYWAHSRKLNDALRQVFIANAAATVLECVEF